MSDTGIILTFTAAFVAFIFGILLLLFWGAQTACMAKWDSKFQPTFALFEGCRIVVKGERIPADNYRVL